MTTMTMPLEVSQASNDEVLPSDLLGVYKRAPMKFVRGEGVELIDSDGKRYLDFVSGIGVNALGYGDSGIEKTITDALRTGLIHSSNLYRTDPGEKLAADLTRLSFASKIFFCNSGAEANEAAFKFARKWARSTGNAAKTEIIALRGGFHGRLFASLAATDRPSYRAPFRPLAGGISICERDLMELNVALNPETVAAVIVEPVQGEGGVRVLDPAFLAGLREMTRKKNILLIFDEIQCGLGRTGELFAYERVKVVPDMVTLAKPLAGGLPMGAVLMSGDVGATMNAGEHGTTFGGGPLVASVARHVLKRLSDPALLKSVRENGEYLGKMLNALSEKTNRIRAIRGAGLMWGVDVVRPAAEIVKRGWANGLLTLTAGDHTVRLLPPLVISRRDLERGVEMLSSAISE
jgi:predicted acetylornithine/succinylornithine family transaminase